MEAEAVDLPSNLLPSALLSLSIAYSGHNAAKSSRNRYTLRVVSVALAGNVEE